MPQPPITIIGDGAMATVMALLLESRGCPVTIWGVSAEHVAELIQTRRNDKYLPESRIPDSIRLTADEAVACRDTQIILNATPTQYIRNVWERLAPHVPPGIPIASVAKGIEQQTLLRPTQIIADVLLNQKAPPPASQRREERDHTSKGDHPDLPARPLAAISGPTVAHELARCLPATVTAASDDEAFAKQLQDVFTTHWFRVYSSHDLLGVELAGALKNVIAVAAGILDGLQAGNNAKSALLARGLAEITRLGVAMGASAETFFGLTGVGDLATTCFSPTGRNRTCGEQLGRGRKLDEVLEEIPGVVEGVPTTRAVVELANKYKVEMPITQTVHQVLFDGLDPLDGITQLMSRASNPEKVG